MVIIAILVALLFLLIAAAWFYIKRVPHGYVEFRSGVILKFLPALDAMEPVKFRQVLENYATRRKNNLNLPVKIVEELTVPTRYGSIHARLFRDREVLSDEIIVYMHGGGWCLCSVNTHEEQTRRLAIATGLPVVSLDYSLAPEHKFPRALHECMDAFEWLAEKHFEMGATLPRLIPAGDSAGGNLAISATKALIDAGKSEWITRIVAIYPALDARGITGESRNTFEKGYYLTKKAMKVFGKAYLEKSEDKNDPRVSPILIEDLSVLPPMFILTAEYDPLRDEAEIFAQSLQEAGVPVLLKRYKSVIHGFFGLKDFGSTGLQAIKDIADYLVGHN